MRKEYHFGNISIQNNKFIPNFLIKTLFWHPQHEPGRQKKRRKDRFPTSVFVSQRGFHRCFLRYALALSELLSKFFSPFYCGVSWHRTCHLIRFDMTSPIYHKLDSTYLLTQLGRGIQEVPKTPYRGVGTGWAGWAIAYQVVGGSKVQKIAYLSVINFLFTDCLPNM